jgi:hypothetical protein
MGIRNVFLILFTLIFLVSCGTPANESTPSAIMPTPLPPVTLAPTYTPAATQGALPTITPPPARETAVPNTPIPFDETVVQLRYQIPLLGLDRRLQGNVANQIIVVDEVNGRSIQRNNEGSIMFELRQALSKMELESMPEGCPGCVFVEYELTDAGLTGSGWLRDPVLLASIENFMTATLGPHFPEGTVIGLRRSASPFAPGHSIAVTENGRLWMWLATEETVNSPIESGMTPQLLTELSQLSLDELASDYQTDCAGAAIETLSLIQAEATWSGRIICPELTLPTTLQPLYVQLDTLLAQKTADDTLAINHEVFPLNGLMQYKRADTAQLTLFPNSTLIVIDPAGTTYTTTLTSTLPLSLTTSLLESNLLNPGFKTFVITEPLTTTVTPKPPTSVLAVRGPQGVYDAEWQTVPDLEAVQFLNRLLDTVFLPAETAVLETPSVSTETPSGTTEAEPSATP